MHIVAEEVAEQEKTQDQKLLCVKTSAVNVNVIMCVINIKNVHFLCTLILKTQMSHSRYSPSQFFCLHKPQGL